MAAITMDIAMEKAKSLYTLSLGRGRAVWEEISAHRCEGKNWDFFGYDASQLNFTKMLTKTAHPCVLELIKSITQVMSSEDTLVVLPTGYGKLIIWNPLVFIRFCWITHAKLTCVQGKRGSAYCGWSLLWMKHTASRHGKFDPVYTDMIAYTYLLVLQLTASYSRSNLSALTMPSGPIPVELQNKTA